MHDKTFHPNEWTNHENDNEFYKEWKVELENMYNNKLFELKYRAHRNYYLTWNLTKLGLKLQKQVFAYVYHKPMKDYEKPCSVYGCFIWLE